MNANPTYDVFVSYRHTPSAEGRWVRETFCRRLIDSGVTVFLDIEQFRPGMPLVGRWSAGEP
jgi:hypothetical protein